jgi:hypothetical protein
LEAKLKLVDMIVTGEEFVVRDCIQLNHDRVATCSEGNKIQVWKNEGNASSIQQDQIAMLNELEGEIKMYKKK